MARTAMARTGFSFTRFDLCMSLCSECMFVCTARTSQGLAVYQGRSKRRVRSGWKEATTRPSHGPPLPLPSVMKYFGVGGHSRLAELDQVLIRGPRMEAANVQVRFAQLFPSPTAAAATAVGVGTGGRHLVAGGHIGLLQRETQRQDSGQSAGTYMRSQTRDRSSNFSGRSKGDKGNKLRCRR